MEGGENDSQSVFFSHEDPENLESADLSYLWLQRQKFDDEKRKRQYEMAKRQDTER